MGKERQYDSVQSGKWERKRGRVLWSAPVFLLELLPEHHPIRNAVCGPVSPSTEENSELRGVSYEGLVKFIQWAKAWGLFYREWYLLL